MAIDPMTVVIRTDPAGGIVGVYTALPLTVVKVGTDNTGGQLRPKPLTDLKLEAMDVVAKLLDPYQHLTLAQRKAIAEAASDSLYDRLDSVPARRAHVRRCVEEQAIDDQLELISSDEDEAAKVLGLWPDTGAECDTEDDEEPAEEEPAEREVLWGRTTTDKVWHAFSVAPAKLPKGDKQVMTRYQGVPMCTTETVQIVGLIPMPVSQEPHPSGPSDLCPTCLARAKEQPAT